MPRLVIRNDMSNQMVQSFMTKYPKNFLWGAATASHQVESDIQNNWTYTKLQYPKSYGYAESYYRGINALNGKFDKDVWEIVKDDVIDRKTHSKRSLVGHDKNVSGDIKIAKSLNLNTYRFSIEWSRIEPKEGGFSEEGIEFYRRIFKELKRNNLEPVVTLWHFSHPIWFEEKGGWRKQSNVRFFSRYVKKIVEEFGDEVNYWLTLNEPNVYTFSAYLSGDFPPYKKLNILKTRAVLKSLVEAHKSAYSIIKNHDSSAMVSIAKHQTYVWSEWYNPVGFFFKKIVDHFFNYWFLNQIEDEMDYIGINYYMVLDMTFGKLFGFKNHDLQKKKDIIGLSDMGWYLYPKGLAVMSLRLWKKYRKPILVTEHGTTDKQDRIRWEYTEQSLNYLSKIKSKGVKVLGYIHWSLMDNLEWSDGHWPKFGLVEVDYTTGKRIVRKSAKSYSKYIEENAEL